MDINLQKCLIELAGITFDYGDPSVFSFNEISLSLSSEWMHCIVGRNGTGKSTLIKLLLGLIIPKSGEIRVKIDDENVSVNCLSRSQLFYPIFQNPENQIVATTVFDDVAFVPENRAMNRMDMLELVQSSIDRVGLSGLEDVNPQMLSGGQKQRLAIAGALAANCKFLILDEPSAMLDPQARLELMHFLRELSNSGIGIVIVSHIMDEISQCDVIHGLQNGKSCSFSGFDEFVDSRFFNDCGLQLSFRNLVSKGLNGI